VGSGAYAGEMVVGACIVGDIVVGANVPSQSDEVGATVVGACVVGDGVVGENEKGAMVVGAKVTSLVGVLDGTVVEAVGALVGAGDGTAATGTHVKDPDVWVHPGVVVCSSRRDFDLRRFFLSLTPSLPGTKLTASLRQ
jgi:hypothetical protein